MELGRDKIINKNFRKALQPFSKSEQITDSFQALADPGRRKILTMFTKKKLAINSIAQDFYISRPAISKHTKILQNVRFINIEEKGSESYRVLKEANFLKIR